MQGFPESWLSKEVDKIRINLWPAKNRVTSDLGQWSMSVPYKIDAEAGVVYSFAEGKVGAAELQERRKRFTADPLYHPSFVHLSDFRSAQLDFTGEEAKTLADWTKLNRPFSKVAFVVGPESRGFIRMFQGWTGDDQNIRLFDDMALAREWLGLPPEES